MALTPLLNMEPFHQEVEVGENEENTMPSFTITILAGREEPGKTPLLDTSNTVRRQGDQDSQAGTHSNTQTLIAKYVRRKPDMIYIKLNCDFDLRC